MASAISSSCSTSSGNHRRAKLLPPRGRLFCRLDLRHLHLVAWLFPPYSWHSDARSIELVKAIFFYGTRLREHCEEDPRFGHELMQRVAEVAIARLNLLQKRVVELSDPSRH